MTKKSKHPANETDLLPDAWQRFERAVDVVAKSPPQPKKKKVAAAKKRKMETSKRKQ